MKEIILSLLKYKNTRWAVVWMMVAATIMFPFIRSCDGLGFSVSFKSAPAVANMVRTDTLITGVDTNVVVESVFVDSVGVETVLTTDTFVVDSVVLPVLVSSSFEQSSSAK